MPGPLPGSDRHTLQACFLLRRHNMPLLIGPVPTIPLLSGRSVTGGYSRDIQAFAAVLSNDQGARWSWSDLPDLIRAAPEGVLNHRCAILHGPRTAADIKLKPAIFGRNFVSPGDRRERKFLVVS